MVMSGGLLEQFEDSLEWLENAVRSEEPLPALCQRLRQAMLSLWQEREQWKPGRVTLWLASAGQVDWLCDSQADLRPSDIATGRTFPENWTRVPESSQPAVFSVPLRGDVVRSTTGPQAPVQPEVSLLGRHRLSQHQSLIVEFQFHRGVQESPHHSGPSGALVAEGGPAPVEISLKEFCQGDGEYSRVLSSAVDAMTRCISEAAGFELLSRACQQLSDRAVADTFLRKLAGVRSLSEFASEIAHHGVNLLGRGRVSVLQKNASADGEWSTWRVLSITGADVIRQETEVIQQIPRVVGQMASSENAGHAQPPSHVPSIGQWFTASVVASGENDALRVVNTSWFAAAGVTELRLIRVSTSVAADAIPDIGILTELFPDSVKPTDSMIQLLAVECQAALVGLPAARQTGQQRPLVPGSRWQQGLVVAGLACLLFWVIPADFRIEVTGQIFPLERRRVFAPDDGVIEELLVGEAETLDSDQVMIRLRSAERELELNRLLGDLEVARARVQAIRATRSTAPGAASTTPGRQLDLSSEEQQWQQRLQSLQEEQTLLEQQIAALTIRAPIAGVVYQRHLQERLAGRPVQRGQLLLEVVQPSGPWRLELQIPETDIGYVAVSGVTDAASQSEPVQQDPRGVEFCFPSQPDQTWQTTLEHLDSACHLENGSLTCLATARLPEVPSQWLRPGGAVTARIDCGRRSLGFVWFREVLEFWRRKSFSWL